MAPTRTGRLTEAERSRIAELAGKGMRPASIARRMGRNHVTICFAMVEAGLRTREPRTFDFVRNGVRVLSFSAPEDAALLAMRDGGRKYREIVVALADRFGHERSEATLRARYVALVAMQLTAEEGAAPALQPP